MLRKYRNKNRTKKESVGPIRTQLSTVHLDETMPEDNHLDSFDIFRNDGKENLKKTNGLKKSVRASFNRDSSFELDGSSFELDESSFTNSTKIHDGCMDDSTDKSLPFKVDHSSTENTAPTDQSQDSLANSTQHDELLHFEKNLLFSKNDSDSYSLLISKPRFAPIAEEIVSEELETRKRNDSSIRMGISINSTNSWLFSDAARTRYRERKRRSKKSDEENSQKVMPGKRNNPTLPIHPNVYDAPPSQRLKTQNITERNKVKKPIELLQMPELKFRETPSADHFILGPEMWSDLHNVSPIEKLPCPPDEQSLFDLQTSIMVDVRSNRRLRRAVPPKKLSYQYSGENHSSADEFPSISEKNIFSDDDVDDEICANSDQNVQTSSTEDSFGLVSKQQLSKRESRELNDKGQTVQFCEAHSSQSAAAGSSRKKRLARRKARTTGETVDKSVNEISHFELQASTAGNSSKDDSNASHADDIVQKTEISCLPSVTQRRSAKSSEQEKPRRTVQFRASNSTRGTRSTRSKRSAEKLQPEKRITRSTRSSRKMPERITSRPSDKTVDELVQEISNFDCRSVSETSTAATISSNVIPNKSSPKRSTRPRVGFESTKSLHDKSANRSGKLCLKGGKWRRTIFDLRKTRGTTSPRKTGETHNKTDRLTQPSQAFALRRKSIFVKNILDRKSMVDAAERKSDKVFVLDESDVESICSADFLPKPSSINAQQRRSSHLLQTIVGFGHSGRKSTLPPRTTGSQFSLNSSSYSSSIDEQLGSLTASLNLDDHPELRTQLLKRCNQTEVLPFDEVYSNAVLRKCRKIGEGVFGEVFVDETQSKQSYVLKIIPIEGDIEVNGAQQKRLDEILQEVIISQELSALRCKSTNRTAGFVEVLNVRLVEGRYPAHLLELWDRYDQYQGSENDSPDVFGDHQLYIVFELANSGIDLEAFEFKNAEQSFSAFKQVAISLAISESEYQFEHRDLHWGNILIVPTTEKILSFNLNGKSIEIRSNGVKATIIDYTLSRLVFNKCCLYQDLASDPELFDASGDYQYDIYRLMRSCTANQWEVFEPYTNVLWLHYTINKLIDGVRYPPRKTAKHRNMLEEIYVLRDELLDFKSAVGYVESNF